MKVLVSYEMPYLLAHGGAQNLIDSLIEQASGSGVKIEPLRWWDRDQRGDIIHYYGRPLDLHVQLAQQKGIKVVMSELLDQTASRSRFALQTQKAIKGAASKLVPAWTGRLGWGVYQLLDAMIYSTAMEAALAQNLFGAPQERVHVISHGLPEDDLNALGQPAEEEDYLICMATIHPRKNQILLAQAAKKAGVPICFVGKPYSEQDSYFQDFLCEMDSSLLHYEGFVSNDKKIDLLRKARGFVLLSEFESGCFAVHEAAAAGLPQLLPEAPWANNVYKNIPEIHFAPHRAPAKLPGILQSFYNSSHRKEEPIFPVATWSDFAHRHIKIYEDILS